MLIDNFNLKARNFLPGLFVGAVSGAGQPRGMYAWKMLQPNTCSNRKSVSGGRLNGAAMTDSDEDADARERIAKHWGYARVVILDLA